MRKPKYKVGDMVYSWQNPTVKREVNRVSESLERGNPHKYRLTLIDRQGNHYCQKGSKDKEVKEVKYDKEIHNCQTEQICTGAVLL